MTENINYGAFSEALNDKADRDLYNTTNNIDYVVEQGGGADQWYRLWRSGWLEQGGGIVSTTTTVTLMKPYAYTNYVIAMSRDSGPSATNSYPIWVRNRTESSFQIYASSQTGASWYTCGQIGES